MLKKEATMRAQARVAMPQKKGIIKEKGWFALGIVFLLIGVGCLALLYSVVSGGYIKNLFLGVSGEPPSIEDVEGFILLPIFGVIFLIAEGGGIGIGIFGDF